MEETICAISTSVGNGAISIIRISGPKSIDITNKIFKGKNLNKCKSHTIVYGHIADKNEIIDEVLVSIMKSPKTYTKENIVEINTHGGIAPTNKVLELLLKNGCRLAEPGEFTKRAFLNGRIDLIEANGIMDMIKAKSDSQRKIAINQINGKLSNIINDIRKDLIDMISNINVNIDYPEYDDVEILTNEKLFPKLKTIKNKINNLLEESKNSKIINNGIKTSIIGKPNVGKSSLLNELLNEQKAIVTNIPGTTRDIVEGEININGINLNLLDTAGIRKTNDIVEEIGVNKSIKLIEESDLVLFMLNNNEKIDDNTKELIDKVKNNKYIIIINKIDLKSSFDMKELNCDENRIVKMSIKEKKGLEELKKKIISIFEIDKIQNKDYTYLSNVKSIDIMEKCLDRIKDIENNLNILPIDMIEIDLKSIWQEIGKINGTTYDEELLDEMFKRFCLGK